MFLNEFAYLNQNTVLQSVVCVKIRLHIPYFYYAPSGMCLIDRGAYHISMYVIDRGTVYLEHTYQITRIRITICMKQNIIHT